MGPDASLTPESIQGHAFTSGFRGYDQAEVREYLNRIAAELRTTRERAERLESELHAALERAARPPVLDEDTLMAAVGEETASILRAARSAGADLRARANEESERILAEAKARADELRTEAETVLTRETHTAEEAAGRILEAARSEATEVADKARGEAEAIRGRAEQERAMTIEGAHATRERILEDLARRRRVATVQIEQLRAGRERLLESYAVVRRTLEEAQEELTRADAEARAAADEVGRRLQREGGDHTGEIDITDAVLPVEEEPKPPAADQDEAAPAPAGPTAPAAPATPAVAAAPVGAPGGGSIAAPPAPATRRGGRRGAQAQARGQAAEALAVAPDADSSGGATGEGEAGTPRLRVVTDETPGDAAPSEDAEGSPVDELFARIRAGRPAARPEASAGTEDEPAELQSAELQSAEPQSDESEAEDAEPARPDGDEALLQRRDSVLVDLEVTLTRKLKRALQDDQNQLLDRVRNQRGAPTVARVLPNRSNHVARFADAMLPLVDEAASAGVEFTRETLDSDAGTPGPPPPVDELVTEAAESLVAALRQRLEDAITSRAGDEQNVLVEALGAAYREWKSQRIERVAGDVLTAAFGRGTWHEAPEGAALRWIVDDADGPCPDCDDDALAGNLPKGEEFPTGQPHPPAHSGCRCLLVPVKD